MIEYDRNPNFTIQPVAFGDMFRFALIVGATGSLYEPVLRSDRLFHSEEAAIQGGEKCLQRIAELFADEHA